MEETLRNWFSTPVIVTAVVVVASAFIGVGVWIGRVNSDRASFKEFMQEIRSDIKRIFERLPPATIAGQSPIRLTELGKKIADEIGAEELVSPHVVGIGSKAKDKIEYEIQEMCFKFIDEMYPTLTPLPKAKIQTAAYDNGIDVGQVLDVLRVVLRDAVLNQRHSS